MFKKKGNSLFVSSTGLAIYAWLKAGTKHSEQVEKAHSWLMKNCKAGGFGCTDATINALKAILEFEKIYTKSVDAKVKVLLNGKEIHVATFSSETLKTINVGEPLELPSFDDQLTDGGDFDLSLSMEINDKNSIVRIPYSVDIFYSALQPDDHPNVQLDLLTELSNTKLKEGQGTELNVSITNTNANSGQPMTIAIIGLPGGLEARTEKLDELVKSKKIDFYEINGREICVYLVAMDKAQQVKLQIDVVAKVAGSYHGPASRVYLYYTDEEKKWNTPLYVEIEPSN